MPIHDPKYRSLYEQVRRGILSGQIKAGSRLPASRELAATAGVSRNTVLAAFDLLGAEGYIETRRGSGTFVSKVLPEQMLSPGATSRAAPDLGGVPRALSRRGRTIAATERMPVPAVTGVPAHAPAFQLGLPGLDDFPAKTWARLNASHLRHPRRHLMQYGEPLGYRPLREAIATHVGTARGVRCDAEQVVVLSGSQQALEFCARLLLDPGDAAWVEDPGYLGARAALVSAGARLAPVPVDEHGLDVAAGVATAPDARMAVVTPSYQFPSGVSLSLERRLALIEWAGRAGARVVEDDYDCEFRYVGRPQAALQAIDHYRRVLYVGTFSKVLFPALRLGYVVVPPDLVDAFAAAHMSTDVHTPLHDQAVLADFMQEGHFHRHLRRMRVIYRERQEILVREARRLGPRLRVDASDAGLHLVGHLPAGVNDLAVSRAAAEHVVHLWPMSLHVLARPRPPALLLGYAGANEGEIVRGIDVLDRVLPTAGPAQPPGR